MAASEFDPCRWMGPALDVAKHAGRRIMEVYDAGFNVAQKNDQTPLTEADMAAHHAIEEGLRALTPDLPVLSEEAAQIPFAERRQWHRYWLVDPLDGTREFIRRNGEFSVNIALIDDDRPVLGIVYAPVLGLCYFACRGGGAFKQEALEKPVPIWARPYDGGCVVVAGSRSHRGKAMERFLSHLSEYECIPLGSALKSCLVAEGKADVYPRLGPTSEWDTAAAQCVLEEAGGHLTDTHMRPLRYNTKDSLLNPHFFAYGASEVDWSRYL
jgi:3'(2'), 5'-bisphosphate nucleotidase